MTPDITIFAALLGASLLFFAWNCYRRFALVAIGQADDRFQQPLARAWDMLRFAVGQKRVMAKPFGLNHAVLFWAFLVLLIANAEFLLAGLFPSLSLAFLPAPLHHAMLFAFDLVSLLALAAVALAVCRRLFFAPDYLDSSYAKAKSPEAFLILGCIGLLMAAYFGLHGALLAMGKESTAAWMPVSAAAGRAFAALPPQSLGSLAGFFWWLHALVLLAFMNYLPLSKHMHIITAIPNCFFKSLDKPNTQPREEFALGRSFGVGSVDQFTWKDLLDGFSCTECGRCQNACPAAATGKPLNPRQVVHDMKVNLLKGSMDGGKFNCAQPLIGEGGEGSVSEDAVWSCTTCGACMAACPVFIEQMPKVVKLRRNLVQMETRFPEELLNLFENIEGRSNPWGIAPTERTKWYSTLDVKPFEAGQTEFLVYVGCAGSFDSRQKHVTVALATILDAAGVSWGILGKEELCCGDSLRRLGNEYAFDKLAKENVELFRAKGITKVITQCPHCFTTLKNDYRQYGLELEVIHHSELIQSLLAAGKLQMTHEVKELGSIVFHDSCYLGRHNEVYDAPRQVIKAATGKAPAEMQRNRDNSFCCGAGGGRMWMEEQQGSRINLNRIEEALSSKPDTICVSCPYCLTMFDDGLKDLNSGSVRVKDIAEVVAEGLRPV
jgi:Fe-S oxidoreductase